MKPPDETLLSTKLMAHTNGSQATLYAAIRRWRHASKPQAALPISPLFSRGCSKSQPHHLSAQRRLQLSVHPLLKRTRHPMQRTCAQLLRLYMSATAAHPKPHIGAAKLVFMWNPTRNWRDSGRDNQTANISVPGLSKRYAGSVPARFGDTMLQSCSRASEHKHY